MQISLIEDKIYKIRGQKVMLDFDLALMYEVETKVFKQSVNRNINRFPSDFMFILSQGEFQSLRSHIVTSKRGGTRYLPYAFTEQGIAMLSSVLNSEKAIEVNIAIIRTFVLLRQYALTYEELNKKIKQLEKKYSNNFKEVFKALDYLIAAKENEQELKNRKRIGFKPD